jgi:acylpyruvate hydrolase
LKLATIRTPSGHSTAVIRDEVAVEVVEGVDVGTFIATDSDWKQTAASAKGNSSPVTEVDFAPLVTSPRKIICLGLNYRPHIEETGREVPSAPTLFGKFARALIGARDNILLPAVSDMVDWEVELAFVVGSPMRHVDAARALDGIAGYTVLK